MSPNGHHETETPAITATELVAHVNDVLQAQGHDPVLDVTTRPDAEFAAALLLDALRVTDSVLESTAESITLLRNLTDVGQGRRALGVLRNIDFSLAAEAARAAHRA